MTQSELQHLPSVRVSRGSTGGIVSLVRGSASERIGAMSATVMFISNHRLPQGEPMAVTTLAELEAVERLPEVTRAMPVVRDRALRRCGLTGQHRRRQLLTSHPQLASCLRAVFYLGRRWGAGPVVAIGKKVNKRFFEGCRVVPKFHLIFNFKA